jgi:hypothetical protein|tara:strand:+ start:155 stop:517 length:363 start_codon:yes stop_codon:yes gene_type:complete
MGICVSQDAREIVVPALSHTSTPQPLSVVIPQQGSQNGSSTQNQSSPTNRAIARSGSGIAGVIPSPINIAGQMLTQISKGLDAAMAGETEKKNAQIEQQLAHGEEGGKPGFARNRWVSEK